VHREPTMSECAPAHASAAATNTVWSEVVPNAAMAREEPMTHGKISAGRPCRSGTSLI
jgi:hypothetical protein